MNEVNSRLLTRKQAANYLGLSEGTLAAWACLKRYNLEYLKIGRKVYYTKEGLDRFIESCRVK